MQDSKPCDLCGTEVPFENSIVAYAFEQKSGRVLWVCLQCRRRADVIPADQCDICNEWKPREGGRPMLAEDAAGDMVEVFWDCADCAK